MIGMVRSSRVPAPSVRPDVMALALMVLALPAAPAVAAVTMSGPDGFVSTNEALIERPPADVFAAITRWNLWWDPAHSYSGQKGAMQLDAKAGGLLLEAWSGETVRHATVEHVRPTELLRLRGGFGPLQAFPVQAVLDFTLKPEGAGTRLRMTYRVGGPTFVQLDQMASPVDEVMSAGFQRLVRYVNTGTPEAPR